MNRKGMTARPIASTIVLILALATGITGCGESEEQGTMTCDEGRALFDSLATIITENSLLADSIDLESQITSIRGELSSCPDAREIADHLTSIIRSLNDGHSAILSTGAFEDFFETPPTPTCPAIVAASASDDVGLLVLRRQFPVIHSVSACEEEIASALDSIVALGITSLVIDLRKTGGGNAYIYLPGLKRLLEIDTSLATLVNRKGEIEPLWLDSISIRPGSVEPARSLADLPVALAIGPGTASASEYIATIFRCRDNTITVGDTTAGAASHLIFHPIGDEYIMALASLWFGDCSGETFPQGIAPDIVVEAEDRYYDDIWEDPVLSAARSALLNR